MHGAKCLPTGQQQRLTALETVQIISYLVLSCHGHKKMRKWGRLAGVCGPAPAHTAASSAHWPWCFSRVLSGSNSKQHYETTPATANNCVRQRFPAQQHRSFQTAWADHTLRPGLNFQLSSIQQGAVHPTGAMHPCSQPRGTAGSCTDMLFRGPKRQRFS